MVIAATVSAVVIIRQPGSKHEQADPIDVGTICWHMEVCRPIRLTKVHRNHPPKYSFVQVMHPGSLEKVAERSQLHTLEECDAEAARARELHMRWACATIALRVVLLLKLLVVAFCLAGSSLSAVVGSARGTIALRIAPLLKLLVVGLRLAASSMSAFVGSSKRSQPNDPSSSSPSPLSQNPPSVSTTFVSKV